MSLVSPLCFGQVLAVDPSMRLLEAAKINVVGNVPKDKVKRVYVQLTSLFSAIFQERGIAIKKALWGTPLSLQSVTGGFHHQWIL